MCSFDKCGGKVQARGLCTTHYQQQRRGVELTPKRVAKSPKIKLQDKPCVVPNCTKRVKHYVDLCANHYRVMWQYSLTPAALVALIGDSTCNICAKQVLDGGHIDHDHSCCSGVKSCGKCVRGFLCPQCNWGLAGFKDSIELLEAAVAYLA